MSQIKNYSEFIEELQEMVRAGQKDLVMEKLNILDLLKIPREYKVEIALVARRVDENRLALKILNSVIRSELSLEVPATAHEKVVYAGALNHLGFLVEAQEIYAQVDVAQAPDALLHQAWIKFGKWQYQQSLPFIKKYLKHPKINDYMKLVGRVNLLAAYISLGKLETSLELANELLQVTREKSHLVLLGNILELKAQIYIFKQDYRLALTILRESAAILEKFKGIYLDFVLKWKLICELMLVFESQTSNLFEKNLVLKKISDFKNESRKKGQWEIVRDCDLYLALAQKDKQAFKNVICKTESLGYRKRALQQGFQNDSISQSGTISVGTGRGATLDARCLELLKAPIVQKVLEMLSLDLYKPISVGALFNVVYPNQYYNVHTSVKRVHNAIYLARKWLKQSCPDFQIKADKGDFFLEGNGHIHIYRDEFDAELICLDKFSVRNKLFSTRDLAEELNISQRKAVAIVKKALGLKRLIKLGDGPATKYQFNNFKLKAA